MPLFGRLSFSGQFLLYGLMVLAAGMLTIGLWVQSEIRQVFIARTADVTALYVDSFIAHHVQTLHTSQVLDEAGHHELDDHLTDTSLGRDYVTVKLWTRAGTIAYSTNKDLIGTTFPVDDDLSRAFDGNVVSRITDLMDPSHEQERLLADSLIETYVPISLIGTEDYVAVAEFYQLPDALLADIKGAQTRGWLIVAAATVVMYLMLVGLARGASKLIKTQNAELEDSVARLRGLLSQNRSLRDRMRGAAGRVTALNEQYLHRVSADLHDGPAQNIALAKMHAERLSAGAIPPSDPDLPGRIGSILDSALTDVRSIAHGLRLPEIEPLSLADTARRVIRGFEGATKTEIDTRIADLPITGPLSVKITLYRVLQEALANSYKHAPGATCTVTVAAREGMLVLDVIDDGPGFSPDAAPREGSLGLAGMRERVAMLGGDFEMTAEPETGTHIRVRLPLDNGADYD